MEGMDMTTDLTYTVCMKGLTAGPVNPALNRVDAGVQIRACYLPTRLRAAVKFFIQAEDINALWI